MDFPIATYGVEGLTKSILSLGHLVGLVLALGTTLYLDGACFYSIARRSWNRYTAFMSGALFSFATKYVVVGLVILWVTGCGFLAHYALFDPEKLHNPKIYAKLTLVAVLTVNGYFLHHQVLGRVARMKDCGQFLRAKADRLCMFSGALSAATWAGAFMLGALPVLNNAVDFSVLVAIWAALVLATYLCAKVYIALATRCDEAAGSASLGPANTDDAAQGPRPPAGGSIVIPTQTSLERAYRTIPATKATVAVRQAGGLSVPGPGTGDSGRTGRTVGRAARSGPRTGPATDLSIERSVTPC